MAQLEDLPEECLLMVLDMLSPKQLFMMHRVNRRMKRLAAEKLRFKTKAIKLWESRRDFSECTHLGAVNSNQMLILDQLKDLHDHLDSDRFLNILSRCTSVKSIDFGYSKLPDGLFPDLFRLCPQLECIKLAELMIKHDQLNRVLDEFGSQLVHLVKGSNNYMVPADVRQSVARADSQRLATVAAKCPNIRRVDWLIGWPVTCELITAIKALNNCWVTLSCNDVNQPDTGQVFEDVIDEFDIHVLDWISLGRRVDRLSSLMFFGLNPGEEPFRGIEFASLKRLEFNEDLWFTGSLNCLLASHFPCLEEFRMHAAGLKEDDYDVLFRKMTTVKNLTFVYDYHTQQVPVLPKAAIQRLKNLETIDLDILEVPENWEPDEFLKQIGEYVDEISSLKKLVIYTESDLKPVADEVKRLKQKQSRVDVDLTVSNIEIIDEDHENFDQSFVIDVMAEF